MTVRAVTDAEVLAWAVQVRDWLTEEAAFRRRRSEGVADIRKAICEELLAQRAEDVVAHLRVAHRATAP